jgi:hypothetical protein
LELEGNSEGLGSEQEEQGSEREENNEGSGSEQDNKVLREETLKVWVH